MLQFNSIVCVLCKKIVLWFSLISIGQLTLLIGQIYNLALASFLSSPFLLEKVVKTFIRFVTRCVSWPLSELYTSSKKYLPYHISALHFIRYWTVRCITWLFISNLLIRDIKTFHVLASPNMTLQNLISYLHEIFNLVYLFLLFSLSTSLLLFLTLNLNETIMFILIRDTNFK